MARKRKLTKGQRLQLLAIKRQEKRILAGDATATRVYGPTRRDVAGVDLYRRRLKYLKKARRVRKNMLELEHASRGKTHRKTHRKTGTKRKAKGHVPGWVLEKRLIRLNAIAKKRGLKHY